MKYKSTKIQNNRNSTTPIVFLSMEFLCNNIYIFIWIEFYEKNCFFPTYQVTFFLLRLLGCQCTVDIATTFSNSKKVLIGIEDCRQRYSKTRPMQIFYYWDIKLKKKQRYINAQLVWKTIFDGRIIQMSRRKYSKKLEIFFPTYKKNMVIETPDCCCKDFFKKNFFWLTFVINKKKNRPWQIRNSVTFQNTLRFN